MVTPITLRHSQVLKYDVCGFAYYLQYVVGIKSEFVSANLPFGTSVHIASTSYIEGLVEGKTIKPVDLFMETFEEKIASQELIYNSRHSEEDFKAMGASFMEQFPKAWEKTGLEPLLTEDGPLIEVRMKADLGNGVILSGEPDLIGVNEQAQIAVLDFKTAAAPYPQEVLYLNEQLTDYQILATANKDRLGLYDDSPIDTVGYMEFIKKNIPKTARGEGPKVSEPIYSDKRTKVDMMQRIRKIQNIATDIRNHRFEKKPLSAYNTPCTMCDFRGYCASGNKSGLIFPNDVEIDYQTGEVLDACA